MSQYPRPQTDEEHIFLRSIEDMLSWCYARGSIKTSFFLDQRQQLMAAPMLGKNSGCEHAFFGGHDDCLRRVLLVSGGAPFDCDSFPVVPITFTYRAVDPLTHRDFLGSLMGLDIRRDLVGDIFVGAGKTVAFVHKNAQELALGMEKVGRVGVKPALGFDGSVALQEYRDISGTVSSQRIDCILSLVLRQSRTKASDTVKSGLVTVNGSEIKSPSYELQPGDILSVRGHGKYRFAKVLGTTKKGRYSVMIQQFC